MLWKATTHDTGCAVLTNDDAPLFDYYNSNDKNPLHASLQLPRNVHEFCFYNNLISLDSHHYAIVAWMCANTDTVLECVFDGAWWSSQWRNLLLSENSRLLTDKLYQWP